VASRAGGRGAGRRRSAPGIMSGSRRRHPTTSALSARW
jgi:hypothetical protein